MDPVSKKKNSKEKQISIIEALSNSNNVDRMLLITMPFVIAGLYSLWDNNIYPETAEFLLYVVLLFLFMRYCSFFIGLIVFPFIPLFLSAPYPKVFYPFLILYCCFFAYINKIKLKYKRKEMIVFILFFVFCALAIKSLIDYKVVNEKELVKNAMIYGTLD